LITAVLDSFIIAKRDIIRSFRQKSQLYGSIVRPIIWLFILGTGLRGSFIAPEGFTYTQYIFPGLIVMNLLFASVSSGITIIWDREFGFLKEIMVAPMSRTSIVFGKTLSGSIIAALQGIIVLAFFPLVGLHLSIIQIILTILGMLIIALSITSLGIMIASRMSSFEGFGTVNNFLIMPLFFLSGALYPIDRVPSWLKPLIYINPVTYAVNLLRGIDLKLQTNYLMDIGVIIIFAFIVLSITTYLFIKDRR
jgi:ABC-2 type transport system permease protein